MAKYLKVWLSKTGQRTKTDGLSLNQNSYDNSVVLYTEGNYEVIDIFFKRPDGTISPKYHMISYGLDYQYDADTAVETGYYVWIFQIPFAVTSFTMPSATEKMDLSVACFYHTDGGVQLSPTMANAWITVNRSNNSQVLDASYNGVDIENLWKAVSENSQTSIANEKVDKTTTVNGEPLSSNIILNSTEIPFASDSDSTSTYAKVNTVQSIAQSAANSTTGILNGSITVPSATAAQTAVKATQDGNGNVIVDTYQTKTDSAASVSSLQAADTALSDRITAEASTRASAVTSLQATDSSLQSQIDTINATQNVVDIVGTKANLLAYDTKNLHPNDKIEVLTDESQQNADTIYSWTGSAWELVGKKSAGITNAEAAATYETIANHNADKAAVDLEISKLKTADTNLQSNITDEETARKAADTQLSNDIISNIGKLNQLDFTGTLSGNVITFSLTDASSVHTLTENSTYELDLHLAVAGSIPDAATMVLSYDGKTMNLQNIMNVSGTMTVKDMKLVEKYSNATGYRWIFNAVYNTTVADSVTSYFFSMPSSVVRSDIIAMSDEELLTKITDGTLESGQLVYVSSVGTGNGYQLGHTYLVTRNYQTNELSTSDASMAVAQITVDSTLSTTSTNPVQNKVITENLNSKASDITTLQGNVSTLTSGLATTNSNLSQEETNRAGADTGLQSQIDTINATQNVVDIVGTHDALTAYVTTNLHANDKIEVLVDSTHGDADTIYSWNGTTWDFIGEKGPYYTKSETDTKISDVTALRATSSAFGLAKVDGTTITSADGVISAAQYTLPTASATVLGGVKVDGTSVTIADGVISAASGTTVSSSSYSWSNAALEGITIAGTTYRLLKQGTIAGIDRYQIAIGDSSYSAEYGASVGYGAHSLNSACAFGYLASADDQFCTALGYYAHSSSPNAIAIGSHATASGWGSVAILGTASAVASTAIGMYTSAETSIAESARYYSYNAIHNTVTFDGLYASATPDVHPNVVWHTGSMSDIFFRNSDNLGSTNTTLASYTAGHTLEEYLYGSAAMPNGKFIVSGDSATVTPYTLPAATTTSLGGVIPDGTTITVSGTGAIAVGNATATTVGGIKMLLSGDSLYITNDGTDPVAA